MCSGFLHLTIFLICFESKCSSVLLVEREIRFGHFRCSLTLIGPFNSSPFLKKILKVFVENDVVENDVIILMHSIIKIREIDELFKILSKIGQACINFLYFRYIWKNHTPLSVLSLFSTHLTFYYIISIIFAYSHFFSTVLSICV